VFTAKEPRYSNLAGAKGKIVGEVSLVFTLVGREMSLPVQVTLRFLTVFHTSILWYRVWLRSDGWSHEAGRCRGIVIAKINDTAIEMDSESMKPEQAYADVELKHGDTAIKLKALLDTGSSRSMIHKRSADKLKAITPLDRPYQLRTADKECRLKITG